MHETGHYNSTGHSTSRSNTGHSRTRIHTHHTGYSTSLCTSCAAFSDSHNTASYSDCQVQQPPLPASASAQPASFWMTRQLMFTLSPSKPDNTPSVGSSQQEDSQHNTSRLSSILGGIPSIPQYQQIATLQPFSPSQLQHCPQCHLPLINNNQDLGGINE